MNKKKFYLLAAVLYCSSAVFGQRTLAEQRAQILLGQLTLDEKVALMQNSSPAIPRLGIKAYDWWSEALHGVGRAGIATVFPQAIGMGASFNDDLLYQAFTAVSDEARAKSTEFSKNGGLKIYQGLTFWTCLLYTSVLWCHRPQNQFHDEEGMVLLPTGTYIQGCGRYPCKPGTQVVFSRPDD